MRVNLFIVAVTFALPVALVAQGGTLITGTVVGTNGTPLPYSTVSLEGLTAKKLTNPEGRFSFRVDSAGDYRLRVRQLGFAPVDTVVRFEGKPLQLTLVLQPVAFRLASVRTIGKTPCARQVGSDPFASGILDEVKKNAERELVLRNQYPFWYSMAIARGTGFERDRRRPPVRDTSVIPSATNDNYEVGKLVRPRRTGKPGDREMRVPQLTDFADSVFLREHCFSYGGTEHRGDRPVFMLKFTPARRVETPDVEGTIAIDTLNYFVREAVFRMTKPDRLYPPILGLEVRTSYKEIAPGLVLFDVIRATQPLPTQNPYDAAQIAIEEQKLIRVVFVRDTPSGISEFAMPLLQAGKDR